MTFAVPGVFAGWVYLRFYQQRPNGSQGDTTEAFAFSTFFPEQLRCVRSTRGGASDGDALGACVKETLWAPSKGRGVGWGGAKGTETE
jgi:hypothetical protein